MNKEREREREREKVDPYPPVEREGAFVKTECVRPFRLFSPLPIENICLGCSLGGPTVTSYRRCAFG